MWTRKELIQKYIEFFKENGHREIPSASLIPENDPTVLFTTAGMHPLVPFLMGHKHPLGKRLVSIQKCIRTGDIEEVGDTTHHTFFEMLGNWSLGDYFKKEAIEYSLDFLTGVLKLDPKQIEVTCFKGDKDAPKDKDAEQIWISLGIKKIKFLPKKDNWWGPAGDTGPCGPDTEMFVNGVEIWNDVFMQYVKDKKGKYEEAKQKNIDTGMGVERTLSLLNKLNDNYLTDSFYLLIKKIESISKKKYDFASDHHTTRAMRIIADHLKAAIFILGDEKGIAPSNTGQGYVLRRLIRRAIRYARLIGINDLFATKLIDPVIEIYPDYPELKKNKQFITDELKKEEERFSKTLEAGLRKFHDLTKDNSLSGEDAFLLFQSFGFPIEMTQELAKEKNIPIDIEGYKKELAKHQELSRTASAGTFKSGLADSSQATTKLHTATHMLNEALRRVLKTEIQQKGSNINAERLRFDFNFDRKLTDKEIKEVEQLVNKKIKSNLTVLREEMQLKDALKSGAQGVFGAKYPDKVSVYVIIDPSDQRGWFSKEICTGPHVKNTSEIGHFKIIKEESSAAGIRRIKAILE